MFKKRLHFRFSLYYRFFSRFFGFRLFLFGRNTRKIMPRLYKHIIVKRDWFSLHRTSLFLVQKVWTCNNALFVSYYSRVSVCVLYIILCCSFYAWKTNKEKTTIFNPPFSLKKEKKGRKINPCRTSV
jgi:hypothetical protein